MFSGLTLGREASVGEVPEKGAGGEGALRGVPREELSEKVRVSSLLRVPELLTPYVTWW